MSENYVRVDADKLHKFTVQAFLKHNVPDEDARIAADALVLSDLRGVDSHGVAHLMGHGHYIPGLRKGTVNPRPTIKIVTETPATALVDGDGGMGLVVGHRAMELAIRKAKGVGAGFVAVRNSRHIGMDAYYAMLALKENMIGISLTNTSPGVVPTFGVEPMLGTNPIAIAAPAGKKTDFVLDMATSVVANGKVEIAEREGTPIPLGWAINRQGEPVSDPRLPRSERAMLPLGGNIKELGSHKGYGLAVAVDILCGVLSGAGATMQLPAGVYSHFFGAINIAAFRPVDDFKAMMDDMMEGLQSSKKAPGHDRIYVAGEPECEIMQERKAHGIPLHPSVIADLKKLSQELSILYDIELPGQAVRAAPPA